MEVDLVVTRGRKVWGIEVKAAGTLAAGDGRGLVRLAERCGEDFQQSLLLYAGADWTPRFSYWQRPAQLDDGGENVLD